MNRLKISHSRGLLYYSMRLSLIFVLVVGAILLASRFVEAGLEIDDTGISFFMGRVGVGTNDPRANLHVVGPSASPPTNLTNGFILEGARQAGANSNSPYLAVRGHDSAGNTVDMNLITIVSDPNPDHNYRLDITDGVGAPRVTVLDDGNVGIGTTEPNAQLEVSADNGDHTAIRITEDQSNSAVWELRAHQNPPSLNNGFSIWGGNEGEENTRLTITHDGNVGIGTNDPTSKLQVGRPGIDARRPGDFEYIQLPSFSGGVLDAPPPQHCANPDHQGRMIVQAVTNFNDTSVPQVRLWICQRSRDFNPGAGWACIDLNQLSRPHPGNEPSQRACRQ